MHLERGGVLVFSGMVAAVCLEPLQLSGVVTCLGLVAAGLRLASSSRSLAMWVSIDSTLKIACKTIERGGCILELPPSGDRTIVPKWEAMQWPHLLHSSAR